MATLTPTLTLVSTDATSDELSFSVTDSISVTDPQTGMSKQSITATGGNHILTAAVDTTKIFFIRHTGVDASDSSVTTTLAVEDEDNVQFIKLDAGEWCYFPYNNGTKTLQLQASAGTIVAEYMFFSHA